jgi:hypothetical protein
MNQWFSPEMRPSLVERLEGWGLLKSRCLRHSGHDGFCAYVLPWVSLSVRTKPELQEAEDGRAGEVTGASGPHVGG